MALTWDDVDLAAGIIRVERSWDRGERRTVEAKTRAGRRRVPIAQLLRRHLLEHRLREGRSEGLVFGRDGVCPVDPSSLRTRAHDAWEAAGLEPIRLHEARHSFASIAIAAGVNLKALCAYMGHASITITMDRYGHLLPGSEDEAAGLLDAYLARADPAVAGRADRNGSDRLN